VQAQGYPIYVVGLGSNLDRRTLQAIADASRGGQAFVAPGSDQLASIYASLSQRIKTQYGVAYRSNVRAVTSGTELTVTLQVVRAGQIIGTGTTSFVVPEGRGIVAPVGATPEPVSETPTIQTPHIAGPYSPEVAALLGTASALSLLLWLFVISSSQSLNALEQRRLATMFTPNTDERGRPRTRSFSERVLLPVLSGVGKRLGRFTTGSIAEHTARSLAQAGHPLNLGPAEFVGLQVGLSLVGFVLCASVAAWRLGPQLGWVLLIGLIGAMAGILFPRLWLARTVSARRRRILRALPSALDMLALSARAGMTFDGAISQVVQRWDSPLSEEFRQILIEFRMGRDRRDALRAMAERTGVVDVARFANSVIQADALGVPISKVLLDQSVEMRTRRRQRAEEAARIAPVKMLFPMVGLIFPALFVVILGPAVPRFLELFALTN
jgi:tight adherence protein C